MLLGERSSTGPLLSRLQAPNSEQMKMEMAEFGGFFGCCLVWIGFSLVSWKRDGKAVINYDYMFTSSLSLLTLKPRKCPRHKGVQTKSLKVILSN